MIRSRNLLPALGIAIALAVLADRAPAQSRAAPEGDELTAALAARGDVQKAAAFYARRRVHDDYQAKQKQKALKTRKDVEQLKEHYEAARQIADLNGQHLLRRLGQVAAAPPRAVEYGTGTAKINWPEAIGADGRFADDRKQLALVFAAPFQHADRPAALDVVEAQRAIHRMEERLKTALREQQLSAMQYVAAKRFLAGLVDEARTVARLSQEITIQLAGN